ncbi:MAG: biopolymer transporter ExbD [Dysgonamonadaceae bacterium]|jgi:biopolymer transport protein ExbD|nr:biopolymer transporter ExbD [Dysgonamonadaceae bacterium]
MAEVQANDHGNEGGKNKQKKQTLRVDFTPMVDMNMLLITFFMFCTTLLKPQTMNLSMPSKDKPIEGNENKVRESGAVTLLLGTDNEIYYYFGMLKDEVYQDTTFLKQTAYGADGIRKILLEKNTGTYEKIQELKVQLHNKEIPDSIFKKKTNEIQDEAMKVLKIAPTVMIKPTDFSSYKNMVDALDEMVVCNIGTYAVMDLVDGDRYLLYKKTNNPIYLTEEQIKQTQTQTIQSRRR